MKYIKALIAVIALVLADQFTKHLASAFLKGSAQGKILVPGVFRLLYLENRGSAFGMMQNKIPFLLIFTIVVLAVVVYFYIRLPYTRRMLPLRLGAVFITAGALGNFIDRVFQGYVVDFFYFELINFPIFNVADIYVTVSATALVLLILFHYKDEDFAAISAKGKLRGGEK